MAYKDLLVRTLSALGVFLPVSLHRYTYETLLKRRAVFPLSQTETETIALFLAYYYPSIQTVPELQSLFKNIDREKIKTKMPQIKKALFTNIVALKGVASSFFETPDKVEIGIDLYLVSLRLDPNQPEIYQKLGNYYSFIRTPEAQAKAMSYYDKALRLKPGLADVVFKVFDKAMYFYDFRTAATVIHRYENFWKKQASKRPLDYRLWLSYGELYHELGDIQKALKNYKKARGAAPNDIKILKQMSKIAAEAGYITDAIVLSRQALKFSPGDPEILSRISVLSAMEGRRITSVEWPKRILEKNPEDGWALLTLGKIYFVMKDYDQATPLLVQGLDAIQEDKEGWVFLAQIYRELGEVDLAVQAYENISRFPDNPKGYAKAGDYLLELGRKEAALGNFLKAANINFRYPGINYKISTLYRELNYPNEAIKYLQTAIEINPKNIEYQI